MRSTVVVDVGLDGLFRCASAVRLRAPEGFVQRVVAALADDARSPLASGLARLYGRARRAAGRRRAALASSALVVGAVLAGWEARRLCRSRGQRSRVA